MRMEKVELITVAEGLNPYYTGSYSMRVKTVSEHIAEERVLILIILEVTL